MLGPFDVQTLEDGNVIKETKREVLEVLRRQPAYYPCSAGCDGASRFSRIVTSIRNVCTDRTHFRHIPNRDLVPSRRTRPLVHLRQRRQDNLLGRRHRIAL